MTVSRYNRAPVLGMGEQLGTSRAIQTIRAAIKDGRLKTRETVVNEGQRLDTLAGTIYGSGTYWWLLAASSNVGWGLQVPPGTIILVVELADALALIG